MAAPADVTMKDLSGKWVMNSTLSDDIDAMLALQGVGWWTRKAIGLATVTLHCKQYTGDDNFTHIDIEQTATAGLKGTTEHRILDWTPREHEDYIFGKVSASARWCSLATDTYDSFLTDDWLQGDSENGGPNGEKFLESRAVNEERGWTAQQIWGFAIMDEGKRYHVRRVITTKGNKVIKIRLVYNWQGKE